MILNRLKTNLAVELFLPGRPPRTPEDAILARETAEYYLNMAFGWGVAIGVALGALLSGIITSVALH